MSRPNARTADAELRRQVLDRYRSLASADACCGDSRAGPCCEGSQVGRQLGYSSQELDIVPEGANLGLGCGNPTALASLRRGEVVLDLGSGAGIDCLLAAKKVGARGRVIGVDMTPEMLAKARANAEKGRYRNVDFRLGEIEHLPVADRSVDVVVSNCVINLVPDKAAVYREAFRVLRPGGRLAISDLVATRPIPRRARADPSLWSSCSSGAIGVKAVRSLLTKAGFTGIEVDPSIAGEVPETLERPAALGVVAASIRARRPFR